MWEILYYHVKISPTLNAAFSYSCTAHFVKLLPYILHDQKASSFGQRQPTDKPVRGQYQSLAAVAHLCQGVPQLTSCHRVDPGRWLVKKNN